MNENAKDKKPRPVSKRQRQVLDFIERYRMEHGFPPSVREIGAALGMQSTSTVHGHLSRLEEKGLLQRVPTKPRAMQFTKSSGQEPVHVPLLGRVTAGAPILAVENREAMLPLPRTLVQEEDHAFVLQIRGESMIEAGILDGDQVIVRQQEDAVDGDIVVALIDDEATVKRFFRESDHIRLQPENSSMEPIRTREVQILGKVIGLIRSFDS